MPAGEAGQNESGTDRVLAARQRYDVAMLQVRSDLERDLQDCAAGANAIAARAEAVDRLVETLWASLPGAGKGLPRAGIALLAVGGYGRRELFLYSDVDLMFLQDGKQPDRAFKETVRTLNQMLWDAGLRVSPMTRTLAECERFDPENVEFTLSLLDARHVAGDAGLTSLLLEKVVPKLIAKDGKKVTARLLDVTRLRHKRYGNTLFHLEPNVKECPGGLRDAHVCEWLRRLQAGPEAEDANFADARTFLLLTRCFLHLKHGRDDNGLDWHTQDEAATAGLGIGRTALDAAYWMRMYFRHARSIDRRLTQAVEAAQPASRPRPFSFAADTPISREQSHTAYEFKQGRLAFRAQPDTADPAHTPDAVLSLFGAMARTGARLAPETEARVEEALPFLSTELEDGPALWHGLRAILLGASAGRALRTMHALGLLELLIPEFHGIDALVIRDAYHRYTVDEHTFVLIDLLHDLQAPGAKSPTGMEAFSQRFASLLRELPHPELLYLAALLHDTGKGHAAVGHAQESARMAADVLHRLDLDGYEAGLVLDLIRNHLEMSAALRRDVFDTQTVRGFAARVATPEALRMLALFTYADIAAVHPDALTPWKAENLWRLYVATANFLDRSVDEERVAATADTELREVIHRIHALLPGREEQISRFLDGFPRRYLQTRAPESIRDHFLGASSTVAGTQPESDHLSLRFAPGMSELTLVTRERPNLFAATAGALAAWGMNIVSADAFSNAHGVVVDSFRFTDTFRTLELNESERTRFVENVRQILSGTISLEPLLASRRRGRAAMPKLRVESRIDFNDAASTHSTLLEVIAQDTLGLLRTLSRALAEQACNIEVALVDTEGEMAIDVFYLTVNGGKLDAGTQAALRQVLLEAIEENAA